MVPGLLSDNFGDFLSHLWLLATFSEILSRTGGYSLGATNFGGGLPGGTLVRRAL
jgi:hypothetical protein